ncbi:phenylacetate--CoA ligase family protein [Nocardia sp. NPDC057227]|uniref:phenylacetate--CoA ligase family protein n=1 Tax=Nocardia sp. NPDC057227 TaxID=3346056 RepID=UPI003630B7A4
MPQRHTPPGFTGALRTFRDTAEYVPAYRDFLRRHNIDPDDIRTARDFAELPPVTKDNYINAYPPHELLPLGRISGAETWSASSGSSGRPTYWARGTVALKQSIELHRRILRAIDADSGSVLVVVGFAMGNWIGGTYTYQAITGLHGRGVPVSVITPGADVPAIRDAIRRLGPHYTTVVVAGYPPFLRDVLDTDDLELGGVDLRLLMAGENISEPWRDNVLELAGKPGRFDASCLIYGTADLGMVGHETASTIAVRRYTIEHPEILGGAAAMPTLVEVDPAYRYVETDAEGQLLFTAAPGTPLIRYRIGDQGAVLSPGQLRASLRRAGCPDELRPSVRGARYVVLHGRSGVAATFYSVKIPDEALRAALADPRLTPTLTGKFLLDRVDDERFRSELRLRVQLRRGIAPGPGLAELVGQVVVDSLRRVSSEYRELHRTYGAAAEPEVALDHFAADGYGGPIKHRSRRAAA